MLTALQLLNVIKQTGKKLSELAAEVTTYPQELVNVRVTDKKAALDNEVIKAAIAKVEDKMETKVACSCDLAVPKICCASWRKLRRKSSFMTT